MSISEVQTKLRDAGFDPGPVDGLWGPRSRAALDAALAAKPEPGVAATVPLDWMPPATMARIIVHWTGGRHEPNAGDVERYHILIKGDGTLVRGKPSIKLNERIEPGKPYAAHTANANTGSIGVALCGMFQAQEVPFDPGPEPITPESWAVLIRVVADLCRVYAVPVGPKTVLSHAEVQANLGIRQANKWDIARLPWAPEINGAWPIGQALRVAVSDALRA